MAGVRVGLAALRALDVKRSGGTQLYAIIETGEEHGGMCFGDGVQYTTGCTFGKGNIRKNPLGKLAVTLIDKDGERAVRVSYKPTLQKQIAEFGLYAAARGRRLARRDLAEADQMELVDLVWNTPESDILIVAPVFDYPYNWLPEVMGFAKCEQCGESGGSRLSPRRRRQDHVHSLFRLQISAHRRAPC